MEEGKLSKMTDYDYELLLKDLSEGREIEFRYHRISYGIVHFSEGWFFVADNKQISGYYKNPHELVNTISVEGKSLEELFNNEEIPDEGFYIL